MSKKDLEDLLRRLEYAAYKVARDLKQNSTNALKFRVTDYRTSIGHAKLMRRERRWNVEVDKRIAEINHTRTITTGDYSKPMITGGYNKAIPIGEDLTGSEVIKRLRKK